MSACADKSLLLNALLDGELDAGNALACEEHVKVCAGCEEELRSLREQRALLAAPGVRHAASNALRARVRAALEAEATMPLDTDPIQAARSIQRLKAIRDMHEATIWISHDPEDWAELPHAPTPIE